MRRRKKKGKASTPSNFTQRKNKERKEDFTRMTKDKVHFPCVKLMMMMMRLQRTEGKNKEKRMERVIRISETVKREASNRINESEPEESITFILRGYSDRFISRQG